MLLQLLKEGLRYHRKMLLLCWGAALLMALVVHVLTSFADVDAEPAEAVVHLVFYPLFLLLGSVVAGFIAMGIEKKERRLLLLLPLPVTRGQVGVARVLLPGAILLLGLVVAGLLAFGILALHGEPPSAKRLLTLIFITGQFFFFLQLPLTFDEIHEAKERRHIGTVVGLCALLLAMGAGIYWIELGPLSGPLPQAAASGALGLMLAVLNILLFQQRTSFSR